jgi:hypothetical protein
MPFFGSAGVEEQEAVKKKAQTIRKDKKGEMGSLVIVWLKTRIYKIKDSVLLLHFAVAFPMKHTPAGR